jgi:outer membrane protein assembly factor BamB
MRWGLVALAFVLVILVVGASFGLYLLTMMRGGTTLIVSGSSTTLTTSIPSSSSVSYYQSTSLLCPGSRGGVAPGDWTTYHGDNARSGYTGSATVDCVVFGWKSGNLDGDIYAEPLVFGGRVFIATENDSVYALNASTGDAIWRAHLGDPVPRSQLPCGNINPTGITGTPVIDPASETIYAVTFDMPGKHFLVALNTQDGSVRFSVSADPAGSDPKVEQQRAALTLGNGKVYVPFGGLFGDCGSYHGWVVSMNTDGSGPLASYQVPTEREGGIWAASGAVLDSGGNLFVATGNGASTSTYDYGNTVIKLSPGLQNLSYFAPSNWASLNGADTDVGSAGPALVGQGMIFQIGKEGVGYLLNSSNLGGIGGEIYSSKVCSSVFGGNGYARGVVFVPCSDGLAALRLSSGSFQVAWRGPGFSAGPPIVTGDVVWTLETSSGILSGFNATTGQGLYSFDVGAVTHFTTPSAGENRLFVAARTQVSSYLLG